jgi:peroxiredoxin
MPLHIGDAAPDFTAETMEGTILFHDWIGDEWVVLFSHPKDEANRAGTYVPHQERNWKKRWKATPPTAKILKL